MTPFTRKNLAEIKDSAPEFGFSEIQEARFASSDLEAEETGLSYHRLKPGRRSAFAHKHDDADEVYVVIDGGGRMKLDEEILELRPLDAVRSRRASCARSGPARMAWTSSRSARAVPVTATSFQAGWVD